MILDRFKDRTGYELKRDETALVEALQAGGCEVKGRTVRCGFCDDRKPSGGIFNGDGIYRYKCHACRRSGTIIDVLSWVEKIEPVEVLKSLRFDSRKYKTKPDYTPKEPQKNFKIYSSLAEANAALPGRIVLEHKYIDETSENTLMFVYRLDTPDGKTYRPISPVKDGFALQAPQKPWPIYNLPGIIASDTVIFVEGEKCVDAVTKYGFCATTTPTGAGKAMCADLTPLKGKTVYIWPDNDEDGMSHGRDLKDILLKLGCKVYMVTPANLDLEDKEDAYDFISQLKILDFSPEQVKAEIQRALDFAEPVCLSGGLLKLIEDTEAGLRENIALPFGRLGKLSRPLLPETLLLLCGTPGSGKSFFVMQCLLYWLNIGVKSACYMLEESKEYHLYRALAMLESNANLFDPDWLKVNASTAKEAYQRHVEILNKLGACLWSEPEKQLSYTELICWVTAMAKDGCRVICIDPLTAAKQNSEPWVADTDFLIAIKKIAVDYQVSIFLVTHPKKGKTAPGLDDLSGGAAFQRLAQTIFWLEFHKQLKEEKIKADCGTVEMKFNRTVHICKARNGRGPGLALGFNFSGEFLLFAEQGIIIK